MIRTDALTKTYGSGSRAITALDDVSLSIEPGVWGVVGPNGAGKTTLLGLILGFLHPTGGAVSVHARPPRQYLRRHGAAYLPERFRLPTAWPVRSALHALARLEGRRSADARARADEAIDMMGLAAHADRPIGALSRGLAQRVGLAQALLADHDLVVLDEPTEGLDPLWRVRFRDLVAQLRNDHRTLLLASHDLGEVERLADRVILLDDGRVREVLDVRQPSRGPLRYRLLTDADLDAVRVAFPEGIPDAFPDAVADANPGDRADHADRDPSVHGYVLTVADPGELSHRLAALLDGGATVHALVPLTDDLETRVRQRLEER